MNNFSRAMLAFTLVAAPMSAFAATSTGNLEVQTTVTSACGAPTPDSALILPFDATKALNGQDWVATSVEVNISCSGSPTISQVAFGEGLHRSDSDLGTAEANVRYMLKDGAAGDDATHFLGYQLKAATEVITAGLEGSVMTTISGNGDAVPMNGASTFHVAGRVYETASSRAFGDSTTVDAAAAVPAGAYKDTVVMTVTYN